MHLSIINYFKANGETAFKTSNLKNWALQNSLIFNDDTFEISNNSGKTIALCDSYNENIQVVIIIISTWPVGNSFSKEQRISFDTEYRKIKDEISSIIGEQPSEQKDASCYNFKASRWLVGKAAFFLNQDTSDFFDSSELSIVIKKALY